MRRGLFVRTEGHEVAIPLFRLTVVDGQGLMAELAAQAVSLAEISTPHGCLIRRSRGGG